MNRAVPILASLDIAATVAFYTDSLGFNCRYQAPGEYAIIQRDDIEIHFWPCNDAYIAGNTACRVAVTDIDGLYAEYLAHGILRPDSKVSETPWGSREFEIFDPHHNLITFFES
jgi:catechol 2,3-dioxygenase-like lactoylglutathione lyase family enzyme